MGPATSDVSVPSLHTNARVTECQDHAMVCAVPLNLLDVRPLVGLMLPPELSCMSHQCTSW